jgi:hypothetical protein
MYVNDTLKVLLVDENWESWYQLPSALATAAGTQRLPAVLREFDGHVPTNFPELLAAALISTRNGAAYHGQQHNASVANLGVQCLETAAQEYGISWPEGLLEASAAALAQQDLRHPQATFFADARWDRVPQIPCAMRTTVEQYSALLADEHAQAARFTVQQRLLVQYWIWSSTFGAASDRGRAMGLDRIRPKAVFGLTIRVADALTVDEYVLHLGRDVGVLYGETGGPRPVDLDGYIANRRRFLSYLEGEMDALDRAALFDLTGRLGWRARLQAARGRLDWLTGTAIGLATFTAELGQRGFSLHRDGRITFEGVAEPPATPRTVATMVTEAVDSARCWAGPASHQYTRAIDHLQAIERAVVRSGGVPLHRNGDGINAIFPDPTSALRCSALLHAASGDPVAVGVSYGTVMVGASDCYGDAIIEARWLCQQAAAGETLTPLRVGRQTKSELRDVRRVAIPGLGEIEICAVVH